MNTAVSAGAACSLAALLFAGPAHAQERLVETQVVLEVRPDMAHRAQRIETRTMRVEPLTQDEANVLTAFRTLEVTTALSLAATAVFGAIQMYNLPTLFGDGACQNAGYDYSEGTMGATSDVVNAEANGGDPIFGDYACRGGLSMVHGALGVTSALLFTTTNVVGLFAPDPDDGDDVAVDTLTWISTIGIALTAVAGIVAANPYNFLSLERGDQYDFSRTMRTVHMGLAGVGAAAYLGRVAIDLF